MIEQQHGHPYVVSAKARNADRKFDARDSGLLLLGKLDGTYNHCNICTRVSYDP